MTTYLILITAAVVGTLVAAVLILLFKITGLKSYDPFTLWVRTLIYGNYSQTKMTLKDDKGFCCLGVACDLHSKIFNIAWEITHFGVNKSPIKIYLGDSSILPTKVMQWLGVTSICPSYYGMVMETNYTSLANLNDYGEYTLKEIGIFAHNHRIKLTNLSYSDQYGN